ncbi:MAG TPA: hypothetical protein VFH60_08635 [Chloroflexia bacterium]|nr:hypothetical protein [Chloroflexia bacterium]
MADRTLRPTSNALRAAGLLPQNQPAHHVAPGDDVPPQPASVSQIFGPVRQVGDKTLIDVRSVRYVSGLLARFLKHGNEAKLARQANSVWIGSGGSYVLQNLVAVVEVSELGVRIRAVRWPWLLILAGAFAIAWNVYWALRTVREWRERP